MPWKGKQQELKHECGFIYSVIINALLVTPGLGGRGFFSGGWSCIHVDWLGMRQPHKTLNTRQGVGPGSKDPQWVSEEGPGKVLGRATPTSGALWAVTRAPVCVTPQQNHIMAERNVLLKNVRHPFLVGLRYSFQTPEKLYFVLDYVNGGEVGGPAGSSPGPALSWGLSIPHTC